MVPIQLITRTFNLQIITKFAVFFLEHPLVSQWDIDSQGDSKSFESL